MAEKEVSTNLVNLNVHFPISVIVALKKNHVEECAILLGVLCWHIDIWHNPVGNLRG
jgi:hypothetical protein